VWPDSPYRTILNALCDDPKWAELPKAYGAIALNAAHHGNTYVQARYDALNPAALRRLAAAGAQLRPYSNEILDAAFKSAQEVYAETAAENADFKKLYESLWAFRNDQYLWWQVAEYSFDTFSIRARTSSKG
jgi:TRAP-type mannitol/chloroaromatic compound transport system substrate-binding protein